MRRIVTLVAALAAFASLPLAAPPSHGLDLAGATAETVVLSDFQLDADRSELLRQRFIDRIRARYPEGTWAPLRYDLTDDDMALLGLPPVEVMTARRNEKATGGRKTSSGTVEAVPVVTIAGAGYTGIRPGALLLFITDDSIGLCSAAHVYGSPGSYEISTAGHCGKTGDVVSMLGLGTEPSGQVIPVAYRIGRVAQSTGDGGIGRDWALVAVDDALQPQVSPTMAFWGGPLGMFTSEGEVFRLVEGNRLDPVVNPDPALVQRIVHYGHGLAVGTGGTPRSGTAIAWLPDHYMFFGVITPGDSGSGANTLGGDAPGQVMEAAGINTHIYVNGLMDEGVGIMAGTRATLVPGTLALGSPVSTPVPTPVTP